MKEKENLRPLSPLGQQFKDMDNIFTLLRGDFSSALSHCRTPQDAIRMLIDLNYRSVKDKPRMHTSIPENTIVKRFFGAEIESPTYWHCLFSIMRESGKFNALFSIDHAVEKILMQKPTRKDARSPEWARDTVAVARHALNEVYKET